MNSPSTQSCQKRSLGCQDGLPMGSKNNVRKFREGKMLSKVALARLTLISS